MASYSTDNKNPYGVMPNGNRLMDGIDNEKKRMKSLGKFICLHEQLIIDILFFLSISDICKLLKVSKIFYVYCHYNELWRDITLRKYPGDFYFKKSWKDTCVMLELHNTNRVKLFKVHIPLQVPYMCSDLMHRSWACRSFDVSSACKDFLKLDNVPSRDASSLSRKEFIDQFEIPLIPCVIRECVNDWKLCNNAIWNTQKKQENQNIKNKKEKYYKAISFHHIFSSWCCTLNQG